MKKDSTYLMYATKDGNGWKSVQLDTKDHGYDSSLALDTTGKLHVAFRQNNADGSIMYAEQDDSGTWLVKPVANMAASDSGMQRHAGYHLSLALDNEGNPHISYFDEKDKDLMYVSWDGATWNTETVYANGNVGEFSSLAINEGDQPFIGYYDAMDQELRFANKTPGSDRWSIHTIDQPSKEIQGCGVGEYASLALDTSGHPNIAYYDCPNHALKYAGWKQ
jgi:hypothetical protein